MSRIWSAEHSNHEKAIIFFLFNTTTLTTPYFRPLQNVPNTHLNGYLFRHYYSKIISDFFVSQKHRKFRIVLRGNLIKHKPALHNSVISEEWSAAIVIVSKINQSTNWKQTNLNFSHMYVYYLCIFSKFKTFFPSYSCFNASTN